VKLAVPSSLHHRQYDIVGASLLALLEFLKFLIQIQIFKYAICGFLIHYSRNVSTPECAEY
jgi:hypothetical protein